MHSLLRFPFGFYIPRTKYGTEPHPPLQYISFVSGLCIALCSPSALALALVSAHVLDHCLSCLSPIAVVLVLHRRVAVRHCHRSRLAYSLPFKCICPRPYLVGSGTLDHLAQHITVIPALEDTMSLFSRACYYIMRTRAWFTVQTFFAAVTVSGVN
jgi:hypothetical protein